MRAMKDVTRREILKSTLSGTIALTTIPAVAMQDQDKKERWTDIPEFPAKTPQIDQKLVRKFVTTAHGNLTYVQEMLAEYPAPLNACWD